MKKVLLITPQALPIPAIKGGAVETLVTHLIDENENHNDVKFFIISVFDEDAAQYRYKNTEIFYIQNRRFDFLCYKFISFFRKIVFNKFTKLILSKSKYGFRELTFFAYQCTRIAKRINPDIIVSESYDQIHRLWPLVKKFGNENFYYHLHYVKDANADARKMFPNTIAISNFVLNHWIANSNFGKSFVVYNGIDLRAFTNNDPGDISLLRKKLGFSDNDFIVLFTGRLRPHKGVLQLLRSFEKIEDKNVKLLVVGNFLSETNRSNKKDETTFDNECLNIINNNKQIVRVKEITYSDIPKYYSLANIQCIPSMWEEGAGLVAIEGMASGLPLIITNSGGMPEYTGTECAVILQRDDRLLDNIAASILKLKNDKNLCKEMSEKGIERSKMFSKENYYRNYTKCILGTK